MIVQNPGSHKISRAILHCAAVPAGWAEKRTGLQAAKEIDRWHRDKGWAGIGYHFLVMPDASVVTCRPLNKVGAHTLGQNAGSVGILLVESALIERIEASPLHHFTPGQVSAVKGLLAGLDAACGGLSVSGHNAHDRHRLCPGFRVRSVDWLPERLNH